MKKNISVEEALYLLPQENEIHTFRNPSGMLLGADWNRIELEGFIKSHPDDLEIGGEMCRKMKHALVIKDVNGYLFVETDETKLNKLDPIEW